MKVPDFIKDNLEILITNPNSIKGYKMRIKRLQKLKTKIEEKQRQKGIYNKLNVDIENLKEDDKE